MDSGKCTQTREYGWVTTLMYVLFMLFFAQAGLERFQVQTKDSNVFYLSCLNALLNEILSKTCKELLHLWHLSNIVTLPRLSRLLDNLKEIVNKKKDLEIPTSNLIASFFKIEN